MVKSRLKSTVKSAINRAIIKEAIIKTIVGSEKPLSTEEIAKNLSKSWHTIIRYCLDLTNEDKLVKFEIGRISVWQIKK
ncbi:MAG: hypothetical protein AABW51_03355 [Nanoarchaeota archaeon]